MHISYAMSAGKIMTGLDKILFRLFSRMFMMRKINDRSGKLFANKLPQALHPCSSRSPQPQAVLKRKNEVSCRRWRTFFLGQC